MEYTPKQIALRAAKALDDRKGLDIRLLEVGDVTSIADYFLICTGTSNTHVKTLCDAAEAAVEEMGEPLLHREGHRGGTWVLLDFGCVVVHVFTNETREFYDLERLWNDAQQVPMTFDSEIRCASKSWSFSLKYSTLSSSSSLIVFTARSICSCGTT